MRFRLRTLMIVLAIGPPLLAAVWWYWQAALAFIALAFILEPALFINAIIGIFCYTFGGLCHLIGRLPGGHDRKDPE